VKVTLTLNGASHTAEVSPWKRLLDVLREDLRLTGTRKAAARASGGACTVDARRGGGQLVLASPVVQCDARAGDHVRASPTATSCTPYRRPGRVRRCAVRHLHAGHRGVRAHVVDRGLVIGRDDALGARQVRELLAGNICRCTGYQLIVDAVIAAARESAER